MFPKLVINYSRNLALIDPVHGCELSMRVSGGHFSYLGHLNPCKFGGSRVLTGRLPISALVDHVLNVFVLGSKKQMRRVAARPEVAMVQNLHAFRHRPEVDYPTRDVRVDDIASPSAFLDLAIAACGDSGGPNPTRSKLGLVRRYRSILVNLLPKSFKERDGEALREGGILNKVRRHIDSRVVNVLARMQLQLRRALSFCNPTAVLTQAFFSSSVGTGVIEGC